jgi:pimeloyl-ACP methyl ester carboxylesterase
MHYNNEMYSIRSKQKVLILLCLNIVITTGLASTTYAGFASPENKTLMQPQSVRNMSINTNATNIVLVHGAWADGSSWSKEIPILQNAGHKVVAVQLPEHSLADDVETVKRAVEHIGGPAILVGHSYGGAVITNAGYNNPNVTGLVYIAAFAPDEGQSLSNFVDITKLPPGFLQFDSGGFAYINPAMFHEGFAQDVTPAESVIMATVQKPINQSILTEKSGPPAWKQLPTWYQVSESDRVIPPRFPAYLRATNECYYSVT